MLEEMKRGGTSKHLGVQEYLSQKSDGKLYFMMASIYRVDRLGASGQFETEYVFKVLGETPLEEYERQQQYILRFSEAPLQESSFVFDVLFTAATFGGSKVVTKVASEVFAETAVRLTAEQSAKIAVKIAFRSANQLALKATVNVACLILGLIPDMPSPTGYPLSDAATNEVLSQLWERSVQRIGSLNKSWIVGLLAEGSARLLGTLRSEPTLQGLKHLNPAQVLAVERLRKIAAFRGAMEGMQPEDAFINQVNANKQRQQKSSNKR